MNNGMLRWFALTPCFFAVACGTAGFTEPKTNPVIEDSIKVSSNGILGTLATTAERRLVLVPLQGPHVGKFCAELKTELARSLVTSAGALTKRSQGLQVFRDGVFALCQARMNGFLTDPEFVEQTWRLRQETIKLIEIEIRHPNWNATPEITIIDAPAEVKQSEDGSKSSSGTG